MNDRLPAYFQLQKYNISPEDIVELYLRCSSDAISPGVIVTPVWQESMFRDHADNIATISEGRVYDIEYNDQKVTLVKSGVGAPMTGDFVLALSCTPCERIVFTGSMGGLDPAMEIGDLVIPERSLCGDGFSRYLDEDIQTKDCFPHPVNPDPGLTQCISNHTRELCQKESVSIHRGVIFSIDTIIAQFFRLDYFINDLNCIGIEMETSAVFKAAKLMNIKASALLQVSDLPVRNKSLFSGRTAEDRERRHSIREKILAKAILDAIIGKSICC